MPESSIVGDGRRIPELSTGSERVLRHLRGATRL